MNPKRILVVEDDADIAELLALHLRDLGAEVEVARDGRDGLSLATTGSWDLVILDLMLPGIDGVEICRRVRTSGDYTPILMVTARSADIDRVSGLELGADDYVTKPFNILELMARVRALFRRVDAIRREEPLADSSIRAGDLLIDPDRREVRLRGQQVELTPKEFDLLAHFARTPGRVYTRTQLLDQVWGYAHEGYEHTVNSHINRLRAKIEDDPAHPSYVLTVWGIGYKFADTEKRGRS